MRTHLTTLDELQLPLRFLLLDFDRCSAIDSSAVAVLLQTRRIIKSARLIFACAGSDVLEMLHKGAANPKDFEHFTTLDLALEHCENRLFDVYGQRRDVSPSLPSPVIRTSRRVEGSFMTQHRRVGPLVPREDEADDEVWLQSHGKTEVAWTSRPVPSWAERIGSEPPEPRSPPTNPISMDGSVGYSSGDDSSGHFKKDGSADGGENLVYTPAEAREQLEPLALERIRQRFIEQMLSSYGSGDLEELVDFMDVMLVPPQTTVSTYPHDEEAEGEPHLYFLDRGYVSAFATLDKTHIPESEEYESQPRHRLAKYGPGTILGVSSFVMPRELPALTIMPMVSVSDTYCQLLRLPRSRCDALEISHPALLFRFYRLLVVISERRLQDHRLRVVASEHFKINVIPSSDFQRMLVADPNAGPAEAPPRHHPADGATSRDNSKDFKLFDDSNDESDDDANTLRGRHEPGNTVLSRMAPAPARPYSSAPATSPPASRRDETSASGSIRPSGSRDRDLIPMNSSRDKLEFSGQNRAGHEPQMEATLSNFQAVLIDKIRDKERDDKD